MSILSGPEITKQVYQGTIQIDPFDPDLVNPNSYDVRLGAQLLVYDRIRRHKGDGRGYRVPLDVRAENRTKTIPVPSTGIVLRPGILYLGTTIETVGSDSYIPGLEGKSSLGRLGLFVHATAGFIDVGFHGQVTLEMTVVHPLRIYPGMRIGQIVFTTGEGEIQLYRGKYQGQLGVQPSKSWKDFLHD